MESMGLWGPEVEGFEESLGALGGGGVVFPPNVIHYRCELIVVFRPQLRVAHRVFYIVHRVEVVEVVGKRVKRYAF